MYVDGKLLPADELSVAIVGSRTPTPYGVSMAEKIARGLAHSGFTVISGMARGIDTAAHQAVLRAGGRTIGVLGCGLDLDYPRGNRKVREQIVLHGALVSEFTEGTPPLPRNFPRRNRIISGMSLAVIVVEAGKRSGSLITARWALDQGREVMAVPGRADCSMSEGPLTLIRDGACPVTNAADVALALGVDPPSETFPGEDKHPLLRELADRAKLPEEMATGTGWDISKVLTELSHLEIAGFIRRKPGGRYSLA
jgi:DNA processing protein